MTILKQQISNNMYAAMADTLDQYIDELKATKAKKTKVLTTTLVSEVAAVILRKQNEVDFRNDSCQKINKVIEKIVDFCDSFNRAQINKLTSLFHFLNSHHYYQSRQGTPTFEAFDVRILFNLVLSKKVDRDTRGYLFERLAVCSYDRRHTNILRTTHEQFADISKEDKHLICNELAKQSESWITHNMTFVTDLICNEDNKDIAVIIMLNSLRQDDIFGQCRISPSETACIDRIKTHLFGDKQKFQNLKDIADSLGCLNDPGYWHSAVHKDSGIKETPIQIEF